MLGFLIVFAISVAALLAVREMDVECVQPKQPQVKRPARFGEIKAAFFTAEHAAQ